MVTIDLRFIGCSPSQAVAAIAALGSQTAVYATQSVAAALDLPAVQSRPEAKVSTRQAQQVVRSGPKRRTTKFGVDGTIVPDAQGRATRLQYPGRTACLPREIEQALGVSGVTVWNLWAKRKKLPAPSGRDHQGRPTWRYSEIKSFMPGNPPG